MITRKQKQCSTQSSQSGFTIVESLMAVVVAVLMTAIAPCGLVGCNQVQSKRVELATQAAKTYVDGLRGGAIAAQATQFNLLPVSISFKMPL